MQGKIEGRMGRALGTLRLSGLIIKWKMFDGGAHLSKSPLVVKYIKTWIANIYLELTQSWSHQTTLGLFLESYLNVLCGMGAQACIRPDVKMLNKSNGVLYFPLQQNS